jgi:hypothetical protein
VTSGWAAVLLAALVAMLGALASLIRIAWSMSSRWARIENQLVGLAADLGELVKAATEDRREWKTRIGWLERRQARGGR